MSFEDFEQSQAEGDTYRIVGLALKAWGISYNDLYAHLGIPCGDPKRDFQSSNLSVESWQVICRVLCLRVGAIQYGYTRREHLAETRWSIKNQTTSFPKTRAMKAFLTEIKAWDRSNADYRNRHYGFRLRWKVRLRSWRTHFYKAVKLRLTANEARERMAFAYTPTNFEFYCHDLDEPDAMPGLHQQIGKKADDFGDKIEFGHQAIP
jgi:hypothetical protein